MNTIATLDAGTREQMRTDTIETGRELERSIADMMVLPAGYEDIPTIIAATCLTGGFDGEHATGLLYGTHGTNKTRLITDLRDAVPGSKHYRHQLTENTKALDPTLRTILKEEDGAYGYVYEPKDIFEADFVHLDEVSRAMPSAQSGFMQFLAEGAVTDPNGDEHPANRYRTVFGTMNETDPRIGSYPLPPAQLDRFSISLELPELRTRGDQEEALRAYYKQIRGEGQVAPRTAALSQERYRDARDYVAYAGLNTVQNGGAMDCIHSVVESTRSLRIRESDDANDNMPVLEIGADGNRLLFVLAGLTTAVALIKGQDQSRDGTSAPNYRDAVYTAARYALPHRMTLSASAQVGENKLNVQRVTDSILERAL